MSEYVEPDKTIEDIFLLTSDVTFKRDIGIDMSRYSEAHKTNNYGYKLIDLCIIIWLFIGYGRFGKDIGFNMSINASFVVYCILFSRRIVRLHRFNVHEFCHLFSDVNNVI